MKYFSQKIALQFVTLFIFSHICLGQEYKPDTSKLISLFIGVSKYKDSNYPKIYFAHNDAKELSEHYANQLVFKIHNSNILLDENASWSRISYALTDLIDADLEKDDRVLIFFAGHGDVKKYSGSKDDNNLAFLLPYDCPSDNYYYSGLNMNTLSHFINILLDKGIEVILILDACRTGSLVERSYILSSIAPYFQTISPLADNLALFLSCRANQFALESLEWGGGHGLFSFLYLEGIKGKADLDNDKVIIFKELKDYLEKNLPKKAKPKQQKPLITGLEDSLTLAILPGENKIIPSPKKINSTRRKIQFRIGNTKPKLPNKNHKLINQYINDSILHLLFEKALEDGRLIKPDSNNAYYFLQKIKENSTSIISVEPLERILSIILIENAQAFLNEISRFNNFTKNAPKRDLQKNLSNVIIALKLVDTNHTFIRKKLISYKNHLKGLILMAKFHETEDRRFCNIALDLFNKSIDNDTLNPNSLIEKIVCNYYLLKWDEVQHIIDSLLSEYPYYPKTYFIRAYFFFDRYKQTENNFCFTEAHNSISKFLLLNPKSKIGIKLSTEITKSYHIDVLKDLKRT